MTSRPSAFQRDTLPSPTCSPDRWRHPPETRFSWQSCTVSCIRIALLQSATTVVCRNYLARAQAPPTCNQHAGRHHSTSTTTATLVAHALRLILARRPGPHSFTGNSIRRRRTHSLCYYTTSDRDAYPLEVWILETNTKREQDNANRKLRFTGRLLPTNFIPTPTLVTNTHPHMYR